MVFHDLFLSCKSLFWLWKMLHYFWDARCITLMNFYMLTFFCLFFFFTEVKLTSSRSVYDSDSIFENYFSILWFNRRLENQWYLCAALWLCQRNIYVSLGYYKSSAIRNLHLHFYIWKIHHFTIHQKVIFTQPKLIHEVCRIFKLTTVHCDYYHANKNKCFLNQIYNAHYISVQKAISQRKKQTDGIQFHFLPLDFHWAET